MEKSRLEGIRLLSGRFHQLQGLRMALFSALLGAAIGGYHIASPAPTEDGFYTVLGVAILVAFCGTPWLDRYYATTFGRQVEQPPRPGLMGRVFLISFAFVIVHRIIERLGPPPGTPLTMLVAAAFVWIAARDWPWRAHYLLAVVVAGIPFAARFANGVDLDSGGIPFTTYSLLSVAGVLIGLLDHRLLVRLMRGAKSAEGSEGTTETVTATTKGSGRQTATTKGRGKRN